MSKLIKLSETIHSFPLWDFPITGDLNKDINNFVEYKKMPPHYQNLDNNAYVTVLFRLSFGNNITVHTLTDGVIEKIKHTNIENMPNEIPELMKHSFLIEARYDKTLFDNINSIGGFTYNNEICLLIGTQEERFYIQHEKASFDGRKIEDINLVYDTKISYPQSFLQLKKRKDTFAFITILSLMLEAERTPLTLEITSNKGKSKTKNHTKNKTKTGWITKRIYIDKNIKYKNSTNTTNVLDKDGKKLKDVTVKGFLRKQHYGKDNLLTKWIYIDSFDSKRWKSNLDTKMIVDIYEKN